MPKEYIIQLRVNTDSSYNYMEVLRRFREFIKDRRDISNSIAGKHEQHCEHPHIHYNILSNQPPFKSMKYHWDKQLKDLDLKPSKNESAISYKLQKEISGVPIHHIVGYPLKEAKPIVEFCVGYTDEEKQHMTEVAQAYWHQINKSKNRILEKEKKATTERELLYEYLEKHLNLTYTNKFKGMKLYPEQDLDINKIQALCTASAPVDPI